MKNHLSLIVLALFAMTASAQVQESENWYNGRIKYQSKNLTGGLVQMTAMDEGEEMEFILVPVAGRKDTYTVSNGQHDYVNEYREATKVLHRRDSKLDALCFYEGNRLVQVLSKEGDEDATLLSKQRWLRQVASCYYINTDDEEIVIEWYGDDICKDLLNVGGVRPSYEIEDFNGILTGHIKVDDTGGTILMGWWEVVNTLDGIELHALTEGEYFYDRKPTGFKYTLHRCENPDLAADRFAYTRTTLLNDREFTDMDKATLRIMRNSILAYHGYVFQSKDLKEYFSNKPWYQPRKSNDGIDIELSLIEQLNIELIKGEEDRK